MFTLSGPLNAVAGGWQLGGILNFRTGVPIDVLITRPDVAYLGVAGSAYAGQTFSSPVLNAGCPAFLSNGSLYGPGICTLAVQNVPGGGNTRNIRRPNIVPGVNPLLKNGLQYLNPAAFSTPAPGTFGNARRNDLSGPNLAQLDLTLSKDYAVTERVRMKFTVDGFNIFNHANFSNPGTVRLNQSIPTNVAGLSSPATLQPGTPFSSTTAPGFGQLTSTVGNQVGAGAQRQFQVSLRASF